MIPFLIYLNALHANILRYCMASLYNKVYSRRKVFSGTKSFCVGLLFWLKMAVDE